MGTIQTYKGRQKNEYDNNYDNNHDNNMITITITITPGSKVEDKESGQLPTVHSSNAFISLEIPEFDQHVSRTGHCNV